MNITDENKDQYHVTKDEKNDIWYYLMNNIDQN